MSVSTEQQNETADMVNGYTAHVEKDTEASVGHSIRAAFKGGWVYFSVLAPLLVIATVVVVIVIVLNKNE